MLDKELSKEFSFWRWWFRYGTTRYFDRWLLVHIVFGYFLATNVTMNFEHAASVIVIPLVGVLVGLSFAWAGNALAMLQSTELALMASKNPRGMKDYLYTYQAAILALIVCIVLWSLVALGLHHIKLFAGLSPFQIILGKMGFFALSSLSIRECWQIVLSTQWLLLSKHKINELLGSPKNDVEDKHGM